MSGRSSLKTKKHGKSLRKKKRVDYRLMHSGKGADDESSSVEDTSSEVPNSPLRPSMMGNTATAAPPGTPIIPPSWLAEGDECEKDYDDQIAEMSAEMARLDEEEKKLQKRETLEAMKRELASKRQKVSDLKGTITGASSNKHSVNTKTSDIAKSSKKNKSKSTSKLGDDLTIHDLRNDEHLQTLVRKELKKMGLSDKNAESSDTDSDISSSSSSSSSDSDDSSSDNKSHSKSKKKKKKKKKSGISAKASDKVKFPQEWPHAHLQYEHVNKHVKFQDLNFKLLVAGELEILSGEDLTTVERQGRLRLLKKIVYYSSTYEFEGLKAYYAAWLRDIELGIKKWSDDPQEIETAILTKHVLKNKSPTFKKGINQGTGQQSDRIWFCSLYQRNKCPHKSTHLQVIKGKQRMATHVCATCWQKDKKKLEHPECSSSCPHISA